MQPVKKQLEILLLDYFRECYADFPKGKIVPDESPDFIIKLNARKNLGIELTRLNPANASSPDTNEIKRILLRDEIIEQTQYLFSQSSPLNLFVKFLFSEENQIADERKMIVSVQLAGLIRETVRNKNPRSFFTYKFPKTHCQKVLEACWL